jgi:hypothetical protein
MKKWRLVSNLKRKLGLDRRSINRKDGVDYRVRGACDLDFDFVEERRGEEIMKNSWEERRGDYEEFVGGTVAMRVDPAGNRSCLLTYEI